MKKQLIATVVGALILFIWQLLSWTALNVHGAENSYTPNQEKILEFLGENMDEGEYYLPTVAPDASSEEYQAAMEDVIGKPWAKISYHSKFEMNMGMNMIRGFIIDFFAVGLLVWILLQFAKLDFKTTLLTSLAIGLIGYMTLPYLTGVWFEGSTIGYLIDVVAEWGLVGVWLGWFLNR